LAFNEAMDFPPNRAELYKEALDALLKKWDSSRRIRRSKTYKKLSLKRKESMLSRIAAETFEDGQYFIPKRRLEKLIAKFITNLPQVAQKDVEPDSEGVLRAIEAHHGLLVQRAKGIYSFSHLTFQEYYTAQYIVDHVDEGSLERLVSKMAEDRWREVFLLTSGMLDAADGLLEQMEASIAKYVKATSLNKFFQIVDDGIRSKKAPYPQVYARCLAVVSSLLESRREVEWHAMMDRAFNLLRAIERELPLSLNPNMPGKERGEIAELRRALKRARSKPGRLHYGERIRATIKPDELQAYLNMYTLLFDCLGTECYVSREVRSRIARSPFNVIAKSITGSQRRSRKSS